MHVNRVRTMPCQEHDTIVLCAVSNQWSNWCQRPKFWIGLNPFSIGDCHWKNGRPGLPPPGLQCVMRFTQRPTWSRAMWFANFQWFQILFLIECALMCSGVLLLLKQKAGTQEQGPSLQSWIYRICYNNFCTALVHVWFSDTTFGEERQTWRYHATWNKKCLALGPTPDSFSVFQGIALG